MSVILGIHDGHDASAAVFVDDRIVAAAQEERFSGVKTECGYPRQAIAACLRTAGIKVADVDHVAIASHYYTPVIYRVKREANFDVDDYVVEQHRYWKPTLIDHQPASYWDVFRDRADFRYDTEYPTEDLLHEGLTKDDFERARAVRRKAIASMLGVPLDRTETVLHEHCHSAYAYFASHLRGKVLALTAESYGDQSNATVSVVSDGDIEILASSNDNALGRLYRNITLLLGMKPFQHEYKVMGLAPYANERERARSYEVFKDLLKIDGLNVVFDRRPGDLYFHFRDALEGHRFDGIAGALQQHLEEMLCRWLTACLDHTGLDRVVFAGGVAQNIKAAKSMTELAAVHEFAVSPAAGDTSLSIGACYRKAWELARAGGGPLDVQPLDSAYLGPEPTDAEIVAALEEGDWASRYLIVEGVSAKEIAARLVRGEIIGRCCGQMEFGLRALGNRSILADPRDPGAVKRINDAIKYRDFWMPFTPTVLAERAADYIVNSKGLRSAHMTMAFETTPLARRDMPAALHPADFTVRPQILEREANPVYYDLVKAFEHLTGVGALLNTSFNLHGKPIVLGAREALVTLDDSALDGVILGTRLVTRVRT
jgi:carbamoyltransferase